MNCIYTYFNNAIQYFSYSKQDLTNIDKIKNIIISKISDEYLVITNFDFKSIDLFEASSKGYIKTYNTVKLVKFIKKALKEIKSQRKVYVYGRCDTIDIFFIVRNNKISYRKICNHCGFYINKLNSKYVGISETTGDEYECGRCGRTYDTGPIDQWKKL